MSPRLAERTSTTERILLGDEAVAQGAVDAGLTAAYGYPGTPSTEIMEHLLGVAAGDEHLTASWCANEKTAYECALGASMAGGRALVVMKHVGLNVAADPFVNSALLDLHAGLVLAVADDPGMHSSQNEQDSRFYAAMARVPCLEPATQQEAYDMTREAFELSERFRTPVMVRLVTRLCHSRTAVTTRPPIPRRARMRPSDPSDWTLLPANARRRWRVVLERQGAIEEHLAGSPYSALTVRSESRSGARSESGSGPRLGVITAGLGRNYFLEALPGLADKPSHLHVGAYPEPEDKLRRLAGSVDTILVLEEGRPILEQRLLGIVRPGATVIGRVSGHLPADGELTPDLVNRALGLPELPHLSLGGSGGPGAVAEDDDLKLPARPPQLCTGCPHRDSFTALRRALEGRSDALVTGDIGCYTLGALPPFRAIDSCVCMGASISMAKGAADAGTHPVVAVIGDSTFLHSGIQPLLDAATAGTDMTLLILDNGAVGMTGAQDTAAPSSLFEPLALGLGVHPDHCVVVDAHPRKVDAMTEVLRRELDHRGLSVVIAVRECIEHARKRKLATKGADA